VARGFSLLEVVLVIVILGIVAAFVAPVLTTSLTSYDETSRNVEVLTRMRYAMERIARELRNMRKDPAAAGQYDIATMTQSKLEFCRADGNRVSIEKPVGISEVRLDYQSGFSSTCSAAGGTGVHALTDAVTNFTFSYCRNDGTTCATSTGVTVNRSNVSFVDISLTITGTGTQAYTSAMRVNLRTP
jgi:MSHA biogenesis protein MshO